MHSAKQLLLALTLVLVALNAASSGADTPSISQCKKWLLSTNSPQALVPDSNQVKMLTHDDLLSTMVAKTSKQNDGSPPLTPSQNPDFVAGGKESACGNGYDTTKISGVCLWPGTPTNNISVSQGWVNGIDQQNCNKKVEITDFKGNVHKARVIDSCSMYLKSVSEGCPNLYVTKKLFNELPQPTPGKVLIKSWRFAEEYF